MPEKINPNDPLEPLSEEDLIQAAKYCYAKAKETGTPMGLILFITTDQGGGHTKHGSLSGNDIGNCIQVLENHLMALSVAQTTKN